MSITARLSGSRLNRSVPHATLAAAQCWCHAAGLFDVVACSRSDTVRRTSSTSQQPYPARSWPGLDARARPHRRDRLKPCRRRAGGSPLARRMSGSAARSMIRESAEAVRKKRLDAGTMSSLRRRREEKPRSTARREDPRLRGARLATRSRRDAGEPLSSDWSTRAWNAARRRYRTREFATLARSCVDPRVVSRILES